MKPIVYKTRDSAAINSGKMAVYYGEQETDPMTNEWCGVVFKNGTNGLQKEVFRATNSQLLEVSAGESPTDMLVATLALYLAR
jgi:hypothetical protein